MISFAEYAAAPGVHFSTLREIARSPAHYRHALLTQRADTPAFVFGRAVHCAVLEPERFASSHRVWEGGVRRGKRWDAFRAQAREDGVDVLLQRDMDLCLSMGTAVRADVNAAALLTSAEIPPGLAEHSISWVDEVHVIACKARLDWIGDVLVDLKTTRSAEPRQFGSQVARMAWHAQAAMYSDGYEAVTGKRRASWMIAVEKFPPFAVVCYRVGPLELAAGRELYRGWLRTLQGCMQAGAYPGYAMVPLDLTLPTWALGEDSDPVGAGLDWGDDEPGDEP